MTSATSLGNFEDKMLPHLNAAYTLARWLTSNVQEAEDAVQDSYLRAFRFFDDYRGGDGRAWLLQIVRNTCYTRLRKSIPRISDALFDEEALSLECFSGTPETIAMKNADTEMVHKAIEELPLKYREVIILREIGGMSYSDIGKVLNQPRGIVGKTLFRARQRLKKRLIEIATQQNSKAVAACK